MYWFGWKAAANNMTREWVAGYGGEALRGYDDYQEAYQCQPNPSTR